MVRRWLALVVCIAVVAVGGSYLISYLTRWPAAKAISQPGPVVVVSEPTLSWDQVSPTRTPVLWKLALGGAVGSLATRSLSSHSCDAQSWLTFGAGSRTTYGTSTPMTPPGQKPLPCATVPAPTPLTTTPTTLAGAPAAYPFWNAMRRQALKRPVAADPSNLTNRMASAGQCITAAGRYAPLAAANTQGRVEHFVSDPATVDLTSCPVTLISLPAVDDKLLGSILARAPANATVIVAGFSDATGPELLHTVVMSGPGVPHGLLTSFSTQQPGIVQLTDVTAELFARLGTKAPTLPEGRMMMVQPRGPGTSAITDASMIARQLYVEHALSGSFLTRFVLVVAAALAVGVGWWELRRRRFRAGRKIGSGAPLRWWFSGWAALAASMPVSTWLINMIRWWNMSDPSSALSWGIVAIAAIIAAVALLGPWRRHPVGPPVVIASVTLSVLLLDVIHGTPLQLVSIMGLQPVYGGRFYGMGNVGTALVATAALLVCALLAGVLRAKRHFRLAALTVILIGAATLIIDGTPIWGADGGGPLAMFPAFAYLALNAGGRALTWRRATLIIASAISIVGVIAVLDYLRPPKYRTHLGDFVAQVRYHGNFSGIDRIIQANWNMLSSNALTAVVPLILILWIVILLTPSRWPGRLLMPLVSRVPLLGEGIAAIVVFWILGFGSNDSGVSIPPTGLLLLAPLLIVLAAAPGTDEPIVGRIRGTLAHPKRTVEPVAESKAELSES